MRKVYEKYTPASREKVYIKYTMTDRALRLRQARQQAGFETAAAAAAAFDWKRFTYSSNENGHAGFSYERAKDYAAAFGVRVEWLYEASGAMKASGLTSVVGLVGADLDGRVLFAMGQGTGDLVPLPPGGTEKAVALKVAGHSMPGLADDGALIYFEDQRTPPTSDMLGHVVVVELDTDEVLVKRLLRGSKPRRYDLESFDGSTRHDVKIRWAAHITAIIPPFQARRIMRSTVG